MQGTSPTASGAARQLAATQSPGQSRRGRGSITSGRGERMVDLVVGSGLLVGGVYSGLRGRWALTAPLSLGGAWLLYAAVTGHFSPYASLALVRADQRSADGLLAQRSITINRPRTVVYAYWRDLTHLPNFMPDLVSVSEEGARSRWVATAPLQTTVSWDAELTEERPGERLAWRSLPGADVANSGEVRFADAPGGRGCEIILSLTYDPPAGTAGAAVARLFRKEPSQVVDESLRRLKAILETGEAPTTEGQPHGSLGARASGLIARMKGATR